MSRPNITGLVLAIHPDTGPALFLRQQLPDAALGGRTALVVTQ
ncbi:MAG TPA: hypothetical protein PLI17_03160 [Denitromonas sp.]|nr:hypothetical protein [Denitromonas sp.]